MKEKKLLYAASTAGHLAAFHRSYIKALSQAGWEVHTLAAGADPQIEGAEKFFSVPFEKRLLSPGNFLQAVKIRALIRREKYALVITHTSLAAFFTRLGVMLAGKHRPRVVNMVHGYLFDRDTPTIKRCLLLAAEKLTARVTNRVVVMNAQDEEIARRYGLAAGDVVFIRGMGVDTRRFQPPGPGEKIAARESLGLGDKDIVLIFAAEFSGRKNQEMLIKALDSWREDVKLILPGTGSLLTRCRALAEELGLGGRVIFPGFVKDMPRYLHAADICVSSSRIEGLPLNVLEAMACGLPAAVSAVKGNEDLVAQGENGYLYPFGDVAAFRGALEKLLSGGRQRLAQMGARSAEIVQGYGLDRVFQETLDAMVPESIK